MNIQLKEWKVRNLSFNVNDNSLQEENKNKSFNLSIGDFFPENKPKEFGVGFRINIKDDDFTIFLEMVFLFMLNEKVDEDFKHSDFIKINAPAIAFPYVRSYISNLTLQSGFQPIILPSVNFVKLAENNNKK